MMQWYKFVLHYFWIAPHALLAVVSVLIFVRRLHKTFPAFFLYTLYETIEFLLLFAILGIAPTHKVLYRYVFAATLAGSIALRFGIIQEIFNHVFHDYSRLETVGAASVRWLTALLSVAALLSAFYSSGAVPDSLLSGVALLSRSVAIIQAGLLLFLFLFSRMFGLSWRSYTFGIAFGFGIFASTELAVSALHLTDLTEHSKDLLDLLPTGSYHLSVLVWLGYLLTAEKPVAAATDTVPEMDRWSGELERTR
jgi:hypothetical protein